MPWRGRRRDPIGEVPREYHPKGSYYHRVRRKNDCRGVDYTWRLQQTFPGLDVSYVDHPLVFTHSSFMEDMAGPLPRLDQPVYHVRSNSAVTRDLPVMSYEHFGGQLTLTPPKDWLLTATLGAGIPDVSADYNTFLRVSSHWFQDQFRSKISLANFIIELKDFKDVAKHLKGFTFAKFGRSVKKFLRSEIGDRLRGGAGSQYLDYVFNWRPLVEDIPKILDSYSTCMKRLKFLLSESKWVDHRRIRFEVEPYTKGFNDLQVVDGMAFFGFGFAGTYKVRLVPDYCQVTFNASAHVTNELILSSLTAWEALADQLGLNNGPKVLWNATKLSWLVDFFLDSKEFLQAFEKQAAQGFLGVVGGVASVKIETSYSITLERSVSDFETEFVDLGRVLFRTYRRDVLSLLQASLFSVGTELSADQKWILASLADSQFNISGRTPQVWSTLFHRNKKTFGRSKWKR